MRTQWTTKGNWDAGSSCLCNWGLHRYLQNFGGGVWTPQTPPSVRHWFHVHHTLNCKYQPDQIRNNAFASFFFTHLVMRHSSIRYHQEHAILTPAQPFSKTVTHDEATFGAVQWRFHGVSNLLVVLICGCGHVHNPWMLAVNSSSRWCVCWWPAEKGYSVCGLIVLVLQHATTSGSCFEVGETGFNSS